MGSEQPARSVKICGVCGKDVSRSPRVKDETGKYFCEGACFQKHKASLHKAPAPPPAKRLGPASAPPPRAADPEPAFNPAFLDSGKAATASSGTVRCPACGVGMSEGAVLCTGCGYSAKRGGRFETRTGVIKEKKARKGPVSIEVPAWAAGLIVFLLLGTTLFLSLDNEAMAKTHIGVVLLVGLVVNICVAVSAFAQGHAAWGIVTILSFCIPFVGLAVLYYIFAVNESDALKAAWLTCFVMHIATIFVHLEHYQEMMGRPRRLSDAGMIEPAARIAGWSMPEPWRFDQGVCTG